MLQDSLAGLWRGLTILLLEAATQVLVLSQLFHHPAVQHLLTVAMLLGLFMVALFMSTLIQLPQLPLALEHCPLRQSFGAIHLLSLQLHLHPCGWNHHLPDLLHLLDIQGI